MRSATFASPGFQNRAAAFCGSGQRSSVNPRKPERSEGFVGVQHLVSQRPNLALGLVSLDEENDIRSRHMEDKRCKIVGKRGRGRTLAVPARAIASRRHGTL